MAVFNLFDIAYWNCRLLKYTQQHTAGFTEQSNWDPHFIRPAMLIRQTVYLLNRYYMVNSPFNTISIILWWSVLFVEKAILPWSHKSLTHTPQVFSGVRVTRYLVLYVGFVDCCLSFCTFSFGYCVVCSSSIYGFWLPPLVSLNSS